MASRIAFYEAGAAAAFIRVDLKTKRLPDDGDFLTIDSMGQLPVLRTDEGSPPPSREAGRQESDSSEFATMAPAIGTPTPGG